jgi:CubicO group peptidase (beta-lactamase class C family)
MNRKSVKDASPFSKEGLHIKGYTAPGFEPVASAFRQNFIHRGEVGAACAVYYRGELVVDLWGGIRDIKTESLWERDTMVMVFSTTKGLSAITLAIAHSRGLLDYNEPVSTYWPEFAQNGKEKILVKQLLAHQAGLCGIDAVLDMDTLRNLDKLAVILARQKPLVPPGSCYAYHVNTLGFYESELLRRVDPKHRSLGTFFNDEIASPLELNFYIGLPENIANEQIASLVPPGPREMRAAIKMMPVRMVLDQFLFKRSLLSRAWAQPSIASGVDHTQADNRNVEMPSKNGFGTARSIAYAYSVLACGGKVLGIRSETMAALTAPPVPPERGSYDRVLHMECEYSLGFARPCPAYRFGSSQRAFGSPGFGGSIGFCDPELPLGYAYTPNLLIMGQGRDPRELPLRQAVYDCIKIQLAQHSLKPA